ncbi:MAG: glucosylceramidase [Bacteroidales bacterium]|nr:glucosylceramidase [Bacteroidales bacterium]
MIKNMTALLCILMGLWACSTGGTDSNEPDAPVVPETEGDVHIYVTTADRSSLFAESTEDFSSGSSMSPYLVTLDRTQIYQTVDGFGAAITGATCYNLMHMAQADRAAFLNDIFDPTDGLGSSLVRVSIGASDFPASGSEFTWCDTEGIENFAPHYDDVTYLVPILKEIYSINPDLKIIGTPWSAPKWMKESDSWTSASLKEDCYEIYAQYFVEWIQYMESQGFDIYAVTPQNEPLNKGNSMSMYMTWQQERDFIKQGLGPAFEAAGITSKILVFDHNYNYDNVSGQEDYPLLIFADAEASKYVAGSAWHNYSGSISTLDQVAYEYPDKDIYFTEASIGEWNYDFSSCLITDFSDIFIGTLSRMGRGVTLWNLMLDDKKGPHSSASGACTTCYGAVDISSSDYKTLTYRTHYYNIAHASKVIRPGAVRIGTSGYEPSGVSYLAFENPDGSIGAVVLNSGSSSQSLVFAETGYSVRCEAPAKSIVSLIWNYEN